MDDESFNLILKQFNLSWKGYRKVRKGVKKRLVRHMQEIGCASIGDYIHLISRDLKCRQTSRLCLTVSISKFFRDHGLWKALEDYVVPELIDRFEKTDCFTVWSCGCARGEEIYSFNILWDRFKRHGMKLPRLNLMASDINAAYLEMAETGIFQPRSLKEMRAGWVNEYFEKKEEKQQLRVRDFIKKSICWFEHDILKDPLPADTLHLLFLRNNLLTYHRNPEKEAAFSRLVKGICLDGCLVIGAHEKLPKGDFGLVRDRRCQWVYHKMR